MPQAPDATLAGRIAAALAERIVAGAYAPGARLPQDRIALEFGASHVPVREAFRRLEAQGLVASEPRRGVRVAALDAAAVAETAQMRAALETLALRHALPRLDAAAIAEAQAALAAAEASPALPDWEAANRAFHAALIRGCGMPRLLDAIDDLQRASSRYLQAAWREMDWKQRSDREHRQLLQAAKRRDAGRACEILARHIVDAADAVVRRLGKAP